MTLRRRVTALITVGLIALIVLGGWLTYRFVRAADASSTIITTTAPAADASRTLDTAYSDAEGFVSAAVLDAALANTATAAPATCGDPQTCYQASLDLATVSLDRIAAAFPDDGEVADAVQASRDAATAWRRADGDQVFVLLELGRTGDAATVSRSEQSRTTYEAMTGSALTLQRLIDTRRSQQVDDYASQARKLAWALGIAGAVLLVLLLAALGLLHRWVLGPLDSLRGQLRSAATPEGRYRPIAVDGPPELSGTAVDAESMRRQLVAEIDAATAARQGLDQQGPVVAAIRAELEAQGDRRIPGLEVAGALQPAEGVLAGDWWDVVRLPDRRTAVIVTDVAGHGALAGIGAVRTKNVIGVALASGFSPEEALSRAAIAFRDEDAQFATCALIVIDPGTGALTWANAGHPPPMIRRASGTVVRLDATGPLLSSLGGSWTSREQSISAGDLVMAWSDGLVESHDANGEELGDDGLITLIGRASADGAHLAEVVERVLAAARDRSVDWRRDDVTLAALALRSPS